MVRLRVLGESVIEIGERRLGPEASTLFGLLLFLALERGSRIPRATLVEHFWPDVGEDRARHCLRQTLYKLRQLGAALTASAGHVELDASRVSGDFIELAAGRPLDVGRLRDGGASYGDVLPGYAPPFSPRFADWLDERRDHVRAVLRRALSAALADSRSRHRWADVEAIARHAIRLDPLNEEATLALAEATALTGSKRRALAMLDRYLHELGEGAGEIRLPATLLRRRIAERLPDRRYAAADACFVGREASVELLASLLREARAGHGQACLIWGEAGIGKTRLAAECAKAATLQGAQVLRVGCQASDARRPLSVFVDAVPGLLTLRGALGCSPTSMQYLRRLTEHDPTATVPSDAAHEAEFLFANVRRSILDLVDAVAGETTLVIVVEDVHWLDPLSWEVLRGMIDWAATRRLLFLFTSRTEHATGAPEPAPTLRLLRHQLQGLDAAAAGRLIEEIAAVDGRPLDDVIRDRWVRVAEGNPFFLVELASQPCDGTSAYQVPQSLSAAVNDRVAALRPDALRVLQVCAILGRHSTVERLEALTEYPRYVLLEGLAELEQASLLSSDDAVVTPRHELITDAAIGRLGASARRLLHRRAAICLGEEVAQANAAAMLWDCVAHWQLAGDTKHVGMLVRLCAAHLVELGLPLGAAALYERAVDLGLSNSDAYSMLQGWADSLRLAGHWGKAAQVLTRILDARARLEPLSPSHCNEELDLIEAEIHGAVSAVQLLPRAIGCVNDVRAEPSHRLRACATALRLADHVGDAEVAHQLHATSRLLGQAHSTHLRDALLCDLVFHSSYGDLSEARRQAASLVEYERSSGSPLSLARALRYSRIPFMRVGDRDAAFEACREAYAIAERYQLAGTALGAADDYADTCLEFGMIAEAAHWCATALTWGQLADDPYLRATQLYTQVRVQLAMRREAEARNSYNVSLSAILGEEELRKKSNLLALWTTLFLQSVEGSSARSVLGEFEYVHIRARKLGGQDFSVSCLATALRRCGENTKAHSLLSEYASVHRRELGPLPSYLADLAASE